MRKSRWMAGWTENEQYTGINTFYDTIPTASKHSGRRQSVLTVRHCLGAEFSYRQTGREERSRRKRTKTKSNEVARIAKSKQICVVTGMVTWLMLKFYWRL